MSLAGAPRAGHNRSLRVLLSLCAATLLSGCTTPASVINPPTKDWRLVATSSDRERLREWRSTFVEALASARAAGHSAEIDAEGALLKPDAALGSGPIPNGTYRCRVIKIGAKSKGLLDYVTYPAFTCRIGPEQDLQGFAKLSGSQRPVGLIFPGDALRQVFLGTLVLGDEQGAMHYGRDSKRDVAGYIERVGPNQWRLLMPRPHFESKTDVLELVPAG